MALVDLTSQCSVVFTSLSTGSVWSVPQQRQQKKGDRMQLLCSLSTDFDNGTVTKNKQKKPPSIFGLVLLKWLHVTFSFYWFQRLLWTKEVVTKARTVVKIFGSPCQAGRTRHNADNVCIWFGSEWKRDNAFICDEEISYKPVVWQ